MVIQRSWKILSDAGSTSASSTEANRSPGLQSSSDDSNCSNQTTHSMVTSVASPPAVAGSSSAAVAAVATTTKTEIPTPTNSESIKYVTTPQMAEVMLQRLKQRLGCSVSTNSSGATSESAMRSLELLRISVQSAFDNEINLVVKRFMENYFKPAFKNIKENLGENSISEDTLQKMSCALLENAKAQYNAFRHKPHTVFVAGTNNILPVENPTRVAIKRPAMKPSCMSDISKKPYSTSNTALATIQNATVSPMGGVNNNNTGVKTTLTLTPAMLQHKPPLTITPARRQIFWNTAHICTTTKFVLDVQANQAFGFGTDGKERLASKHPELIRYLPDSEDRDWLISQNIISPQNRNSRFLFLIYDEVCRLQQTNDVYRTKSNIDLSLMHTFNVPEFMIQKMKVFFVDLNIKSRGLITNSFSMGALHGNSHLRNALLQGTLPCNNNGGSNNCNNNNNNSNNPTNDAQSQQSTVTSIVTTSIAQSSTSSGHNLGNTTSGANGNSLQLTKPSVLSSSHATLTALLNNSANNTPVVMSEKIGSSSISKLRK